MSKSEVTVSTKGQIVIPKDVRDKLSLIAGDVVIFEEVSDGRFLFEKHTNEESFSMFLLSPLEENMNSHHWEASTEKEALYVFSDTEENARQVAYMFTCVAVRKQAGKPIAFSPWKQEELVEVEEVKIPDQDLANMIKSRGMGKVYPVSLSKKLSRLFDEI